MQTITMNQQPGTAAPSMSDFGPALYAINTGIDQPTPPAPDRGSSKAKPKPVKPIKKK